MMRKSIDQYVLEPDEFWREDFVPEADKGGILDDRSLYGRAIHGTSLSIGRPIFDGNEVRHSDYACLAKRLGKSGYFVRKY